MKIGAYVAVQNMWVCYYFVKQLLNKSGFRLLTHKKTCGKDCAPTFVFLKYMSGSVNLTKGSFKKQVYLQRQLKKVSLKGNLQIQQKKVTWETV